MGTALFIRRVVLLAVAVGVAMIVVLGALLFAVDAGFGHSMLIRMIAARAGR